MTVSQTRPATRPARLTVATALVVTAVGVLLAVRPWAIDAFVPALGGQRGVTYQAVVQAAGLLLAAVTVVIALGLSRGQVRDFWGVGRPAAPAAPIRWLGVKEGTSWRRLGTVMLFWISALLTVFLYLGLGSQLSRGLNPVLLGLALVFAVANAITEEAVFRLTVVGVLRGVVSDRVILALGAGIFGVIHYVGVPGGPIGVLMAGFLGWFLTRSILDTGGMFWAILIHTVQDIIILSILLHL